VRHVLRAKALAVVLGDEAGVEVAGDELRVREEGGWNGMLLDTRGSRKPLSASRMRRIASSRSKPCTTSLAIIES